MAYDLVIKHGRIIDGSGMPGFGGDVAIKGDRIVAVGKVDGPARSTVNADGLVVAPGFIDHHTHMDAQICWDPTAIASACHGVTSIIMGNCGVTMAPCRPTDHEAAMATFIAVEGLSHESLEAGVPWEWETFGEYLDYLEGRIGVNVGSLVGQNSVRQYVMGDSALQREQATAEEIRGMRRVVRDSLRAGALGFSINRRTAQRREDGSALPSHLAGDTEVNAQLDELRRLNVGLIQTNTAGVQPKHMSWFGDMSLATGRPVSWQILRHRKADPDLWRRLIAASEVEIRRGARIFGLSSTYIEPDQADARPNEQTDPEAVAEILRSPYGLIGQSDAGAHTTPGQGMTSRGFGYGYASRLLGYWVRERNAMSIEEAVRALSFVVANVYDLPGRGLLRPGFQADLVLFDPSTVAPLEPELVPDLPRGESRYIQRAQGIEQVIVNGQPLLERGQPTGARPGQVMRNRLVRGRSRRQATAAV
jgi:N-acyl-D-aspartate/D-glutamate deacylase